LDKDVVRMGIEVDWDRYAEQYDAVTMAGSNPTYVALVRKVAESFRGFMVRPDALIADIGGGTGNFSIPIAQMYPHSRVILVDSSERMLKQAREKVSRYGLMNLDIICADILSEIPDLAEKYSRPFSHVMMIHTLYTTGGLKSAAPLKLLKDINKHLDDDTNSRFLISDTNRISKIWKWIPYCLFHAFKTYGFKEALSFLKRNEQARKMNRDIITKQKEGHCLLCSLEEFVELVKAAGFSKIYEKSDKYYLGIDNFVIAGK